jgi:UDP-N-acetyl-D-galactosamine dehydrogenase
MIKLPCLDTCTVAVIGLGYVGLPLAVELANSKYNVRTGRQLSRNIIGFDINNKRIAQLLSGIDSTGEISAIELQAAISNNLNISSNAGDLISADVFLVTVPTPVDSSNRPDLTALKSATTMISEVLREKENMQTPSSSIIIYESTVYPGATLEVCVPLLNRSGLEFNKQYFCGYSPERINPGDPTHRFTSITKVTSGSNPEVAQWVDEFYGSVVNAGTYKASSIEVAEAAKVIENTQRDLNIALVNELSLICQLMGIDTLDVIDAASTKWNFMPFKPGLVGGHCIGVDPYYLTYKAEQMGYYPEVVLSGRRINDNMSNCLCQAILNKMACAGMVIKGSKILVLGVGFKENCPDIRNSKVFDLLACLDRYMINLTVVDPLADPEEVKRMHNRHIQKNLPICQAFDVVVVAVAHDAFMSFTMQDWRSLLIEGAIVFDIKGIVPRELNPHRP